MTINLYERFKDHMAFNLSKSRLKKLMQADDIDSVLDSIVKYKGRGFYDKIRLAQDHNELRDLSLKVVELHPKIIVEIGTWNGGLFTFGTE